MSEDRKEAVDHVSVSKSFSTPAFFISLLVVLLLFFPSSSTTQRCASRRNDENTHTHTCKRAKKRKKHVRTVGGERKGA